MEKRYKIDKRIFFISFTIILLIVSIALIVNLGGERTSKTYSSHGQYPVKFQVNLPDQNGNLELQQLTPYWKAKPEQDQNGIPCLVDDEGKAYYNAASIAFQAMDSSTAYPELDISKLIGNKEELSDTQLKAFNWLENNKKNIGKNQAFIWYNNFSTNFNNMLIISPWPSAFSQAAIIHAYTVAWEITHKSEYLETAVKAALAYQVSVEDGGLTSSVDGLSFYEEMPLSHGYSPHILNGHLYTTIILNNLAKLTGDSRVQKLADNGIATIKKLMPIYDQGYWTRYDLSPRLINIPMALTQKSSSGITNVNKIELSNVDGISRTVRFEDGKKIDSKGLQFEINLPGGIPSSYLKAKDYTLKIYYIGDSAPIASVFGFRDQLNEYYKLKEAKVYEEGGQKVAQFTLSINDLQWSTLSRFYQQWHTAEMDALWKQTKDPNFLVTAIRWQNYLSNYDSDLKIKGKADDDLNIRDRIYDDSIDSNLDTEVANALKAFPTDQLNQKNSALALMRYVYFRIGLGPASDTVDGTLKTNTGSCRQFSNVYRSLATRIGLETRVWNLYDIRKIGGHNLNEVKINGQWAAIDSSYGAFFTEGNSFDSRIVSVEELLQEKAVGYSYWETADRKSIQRGKVPPDPQKSISDLFNLTMTYPEGYNAYDVFSAPQYGIDGDGLNLYQPKWAFDLSKTQKVLIGNEDWSGTSQMWKGLAGIENQSGNNVSLHELGETSIHKVTQTYNINEISPGKVYKVELGIAYSSDSSVQVNSNLVNSVESYQVLDSLKSGYATSPQKYDLYFKAGSSSETVVLSVENGYVLLNSISVSQTNLSEIPNNYSNQAKVIQSTPFYDGYGPENSLKKTPGSYTAAKENTLPNNFTLELPNKIYPVGLEITWNSFKEYGISFSLSGIRDDNTEVAIFELQNNDGSSGNTNNYCLNSEEPFSKYKFTLNKAAGQNRLLMVEFNLFGGASR